MTTVDVSELKQLRDKILTLQQADMLLRTIATSIQTLQVRRIHGQGLKADGSPIGTYSDSYLKRRQKAPFNRTSDSNITLVLTSQMQDNYQVLDLSDTEYAIGWTDELNGNKFEWLSERYPDTWHFSQDEQTAMDTIVKDYLDNIFG